MATITSVSAPVSPAISIEEYLRTAYNPDVEYIDGALREKPVVQCVHGAIQSLLSFWFYEHAKEWKIRVAIEVRTQVGQPKCVCLT